MKSEKWTVVAGARPNFMKIAPFLKEIARHNNIDPGKTGKRVTVKLVHTGQHYDANMSDVFFRELGIRHPDVNLGVGTGSHAVQTAGIMTGFEAFCEREKPDWVIVVGDVNSTMACAIVCSKMGIRVAHIEAGLRSFDRTMPEEINRLVTDALADLHFTPSEDADKNLLKEGIPREKIKLVGNIMIDSLIENLSKARSSKILNELHIDRGRFVYVTLHRPSNVDLPKSLKTILSGLERLSLDLPVVFPIHPRTKKMIVELGYQPKQSSQFSLLEPIGYHASLCLAESARLILTDSGGLQEESTYFRTPCLTLRSSTERPITLTIGSNRLTKLETFVEDSIKALSRPKRIGSVPPLWDGRTAERTLGHMLDA